MQLYHIRTLPGPKADKAGSAYTPLCFFNISSPKSF